MTLEKGICNPPWVGQKVLNELDSALAACEEPCNHKGFGSWEGILSVEKGLKTKEMAMQYSLHKS